MGYCFIYLFDDHKQRYFFEVQVTNQQLIQRACQTRSFYTDRAYFIRFNFSLVAHL